MSRNAKNNNIFNAHGQSPCGKIKTQGDAGILSFLKKQYCRLEKLKINPNPQYFKKSLAFILFILAIGISNYGLSGGTAKNSFHSPNVSTNQVIIVQNRNAVSAYLPNRAIVRKMLEKGILALTSSQDLKMAISKFLTTNDVVGIKVYSSAGPFAGTRPAVVAELVSIITEAGISPKNIIIWDKNLNDLQYAGYDKIASEFGVRIAGAVQSGYDESVFYEKPLIGNLVYGDHEFNKKGEGVGRKSYASKLLTKEITKLISIAPLLNNNSAGVSGHLYSLSMGAVDNTTRFESSKERLKEAVPEIFAMPVIADRAALFITDALICQYEGGDRAMLHYSTVLGQLRFSRDPVALDTLSVEELHYQRSAGGFKLVKPDYELFRNAELLELGVADSKKINITIIKLSN